MAEERVLYYWEGKDAQGRDVSGTLLANGPSLVRTDLRRRGIRPTAVKRKRRSPTAGVGTKDIVFFTRQLATMLKAGIPIVQSLEIVEKSAEKKSLENLIAAIRHDLEAGMSLHAALSQHPMHFDELYLSTVSSGEQSGSLDAILDRLAQHLEKQEFLRGKIRGALIYPAAIVTVAVAVVTFIMVFVIPTFKGIFASQGASLPLPTRIVIMVSDFMAHQGWMILVGVVVFFLLFQTAMRRYAPLRHFMDRVNLILPVFGDLSRKAAIARFGRTLATLFAAGVPLIEAMRYVANATGNWVYTQAIISAEAEVAKGGGLFRALEKTHIFPYLALQMIKVGEETGDLDSLLHKLSDFYEEEVDRVVQNLSSLLEPLLIVILGIILGGIAVAMFLPIFQMGGVIA